MSAKKKNCAAETFWKFHLSKLINGDLYFKAKHYRILQNAVLENLSTEKKLLVESSQIIIFVKGMSKMSNQVRLFEISKT